MKIKFIRLVYLWFHNTKGEANWSLVCISSEFIFSHWHTVEFCVNWRKRAIHVPVCTNKHTTRPWLRSIYGMSCPKIRCCYEHFYNQYFYAEVDPSGRGRGGGTKGLCPMHLSKNGTKADNIFYEKKSADFWNDVPWLWIKYRSNLTSDMKRNTMEWHSIID